MSGAVICCAALAAFSPPPAEMVIRLTVDPMPAPKPALRYQLLPEMKEMAPGNPIPAYLKALLDQDFTANQDELGPSALRQADRAARLDKPDWQLMHKIRTDGIGLLLPDLQKMRQLATGLSDRFRQEVAQRRFDDALVTAKTMFALSRHTGDHPTLIGNLVGIAIAYITIGPLEEMLEQPGCPNLYWALTSLPRPLISLDQGLQGERMLIVAELRDLSDTAPMTAGQIKKVIDHIEEIRRFEPDRQKLTTRQYVTVRARDPKYLAAARARLVESGIAEELVVGFPADQVILLDEKREYEVWRDEEMKLLKLSVWEAAPLARKATPIPEQRLLTLLVPALAKVGLAQCRLEQRVALLRHVEALRMHAADHDRKLPASLTDVEVPLPVDPVTGKPFRYELKDGTAHIRGTPPKGYEQQPHFNLHYEITIRK